MAIHPHDDLVNPVAHQVKKSVVDAVLGGLIKGGSGFVSLMSGLLASVLILYSGYVVYDSFNLQQKAYTSAWELLQYKPEIIEDQPTPLAGASTLATINGDYRAWLTMYGTNIDYPVMQGPDDLYYASHDVYGNANLTGAIYLAAGNSGNFSDNYNLIYGHHMDNKAMFGALDSYRSESYFNAHREGVVVVGNMVYDVNMFAVVDTDAYESRIYTVGNRMDDLISFLKSGGAGGIGLGTQVLIFDEAALDGATKIIALSTCASASTNGRLVVFGTMKLRSVDTSETVELVFDDDDDRDGERPDEVEVELYADGEPTGIIVVLNEDNDWTVTVENLPLTHDDGTKIVYTWEENLPDGYERETYTVTEGENGNTTTVTVKHDPAMADKTVTKVWADNDNATGRRPASVTFYLLGNGAAVEMAELSEENGWTATVSVPVNEKGEPIEYKWVEPDVMGYTLTSETSAEGETVFTNTLTQTEPATFRLGIRYRSQGGAVLAQNVILTLRAGDGYDVISPVIDGYRSLWPRVTGVMPERNMVLTVFYVPNDGTITIDDFKTPLGLGEVYINTGDCFE